MNWHHSPSTGRWQPRFSWSITRDKAGMIFITVESARLELEKVKRLVPNAYIYRMGGESQLQDQSDRFIRK
jgi:hypothetical protein